MKFEKPKQGIQTHTGPQFGVDASNYVDRARAFLGKDGVGFQVRGIEGPQGSRLSNRPATEPQWLAWLAYFEVKGIATKFMRFSGCTTTPTEWPDQFDGECEVSNRSGAIRRDRTRDYSGHIAGLWNPLLRHTADWGTKPRPKAEVKTSEWLMEYGHQPLTVDPKLMDTQHMRGDREATA